MNKHHLMPAVEPAQPPTFRYYPGQLDYLSRVAVKDSALIAADVGTGKSLMAVSLIRCKLEQATADGKRRFGGRALIVAPGGTLRSNDEDEDGEDDGEPGIPASQWRQEIARFAPGVPVFELFTKADYMACLQPDGTMADGIYVTYFEAYFRNGSRMAIPESWKNPHEKIADLYNGGKKGPIAVKCRVKQLADGKCWTCTEDVFFNYFPHLAPRPGEATVTAMMRWFPEGKGTIDVNHELDAIITSHAEDFSEGVGETRKGIKCVLEPCLSELIASHQAICRFNLSRHQNAPPPNARQNIWDMVCVDEAHVCTNLGAQVTQSLIRVGARYRFAFTATPIPNIVSNLFALMGWLCVPDWHLGDRRNAAWPYAVSDLGRFDRTFLTYETNLTEASKRKGAAPRKVSPVLASPARLLKLLKPTMAFISKEACNPAYQLPTIIDVRVPLGAEQARLYAFALNRANIPSTNALARARRQIQWLRAICADPHGFKHVRGKVSSNFNPKTLAILGLVQEILGRGEQVVIISARIGQTDTLQTLLRHAGVDSVRIDSTVAPDRHQQEAARFKARHVPVCFMGIKCAASHSFAQCENEIVGSLEWSYGAKHQAFGRVDRVNSRPGVRIYCVLHKGTIEEAMFDRVATKQDAATICLRGQRVPRDFAPVDASEVLAANFTQWEAAGALDKKDDLGNITAKAERDCASEWPALLRQIEAQAMRWKMALRERVMADAKAVIEARPIMVPVHRSDAGDASDGAPVGMETRAAAWRRKRREEEAANAPAPTPTATALPVDTSCMFPKPVSGTSPDATPPPVPVAQVAAPVETVVTPEPMDSAPAKASEPMTAGAMRRARWMERFRNLAGGSGQHAEPAMAAA
jgi:hypothetical protein